MRRFIKRFWTSDGGATAVEYVLMVALIAGVIIGTVAAAGVQLNILFTGVEQSVTEAVN